MTYTFNTPDDQHAMLQAIGVDSLADLFEQIPSEIRLQRDLDLPPRMGELELTQYMTRLAGRNQSCDDVPCFLGAGSYDHFVPAVVDALAGRGEFYTSYTPYQPEVSQGNLQVMFEYQTLICQLTGMDVSNASLYDGGSAVAEAALMSMSVTRRERKVVVPESVHPEYRQILQTYLANCGIQLQVVACPDGVADVAVRGGRDRRTDRLCGRATSELLRELGASAISWPQRHTPKGHLLVVVCDPISLGLLKRPGDLGADIVVAEGQALGTPLSYGGPYLGIMACREQFVRRMPGRIAGETVDRRGRRCWVLTLQTREQHIRRDKATSNICTNQGLFALRASIYLAAMGPHGLRAVAELCLRKAQYAARAIVAHDRFERRFAAPSFKEFVIRDRTGPSGRACWTKPRRRGTLPVCRWDAGIRNWTTAFSLRSPKNGHAQKLTAGHTASLSQPHWRVCGMRNRRATQLLFELSKPGRRAAELPACDVPGDDVGLGVARRTGRRQPARICRNWPSRTSCVTLRISRRSTCRSIRTSIRSGSCTMKYNPKRNERLAALPGFVDAASLPAGRNARRACSNCCSNCSTIWPRSPACPASRLQPAAGRRAN